MAQTLTESPVAPACGSFVEDLDILTASDGEIAALSALLAERGVVFLRNQRLTPEDQVAVTSRFGAVLRVPYVKHLDEHPDIIAVLKEADEKKISTFGGTWHSDFSFLDQPPSLTILYGREIPQFGGDTVWSSQYAAFEALSSRMQEMLCGLSAVQTGWPHGTKGPGPNAAVSRSVVMTRNDPTADREAQGAVRQSRVHAAIRRHDRGRVKATVVVPLCTCDEARVHLPFALGGGDARAVG
jgi:taurine dioxygenase